MMRLVRINRTRELALAVLLALFITTELPACDAVLPGGYGETSTQTHIRDMHEMLRTRVREMYSERHNEKRHSPTVVSRAVHVN